MSFSGEDKDDVFRFRVDEPMFKIDSSRPVSSELMFKWFGLTNSFERILSDIFYRVSILETTTLLPDFLWNLTSSLN